jgi:hypothetical protein
MLSGKQGAIMPIHDDADMATVVKETIARIKEGALHIGKADRRIEPDQIKQVEDAIQLLQNTLNNKKRVNATRS